MVISSPSVSVSSTLLPDVAVACTPVVAEIRLILLTASVTSELLILNALVLLPFNEMV